MIAISIVLILCVWSFALFAYSIKTSQNIWCKLFSHRFKQALGDYIKPVEFCVRCGLPQEEM